MSGVTTVSGSGRTFDAIWNDAVATGTAEPAVPTDGVDAEAVAYEPMAGTTDAAQRDAELDELYAQRPREFAEALQASQGKARDDLRRALGRNMVTTGAQTEASRAVRDEILGLTGDGSRDAKLVLKATGASSDTMNRLLGAMIGRIPMVGFAAKEAYLEITKRLARKESLSTEELSGRLRSVTIFLYDTVHDPDGTIIDSPVDNPQRVAYIAARKEFEKRMFDARDRGLLKGDR